MPRPVLPTRRANRFSVSRRQFLRDSGALLAGTGLLGNPLFQYLPQAANDPVLDKVRTAIDAFMANSGPVGLAVAIIRPGQDPQTPNVNTIFRGEVRKGSSQAPDEQTIFELG